MAKFDKENYTINATRRIGKWCCCHNLNQERTGFNRVFQRKEKRSTLATVHILMIIFSSNVSVQENPVDLSYIHYAADGFIPDHNPDDIIFLDDSVFKNLTVSQREELKTRGLYGCVFLGRLLLLYAADIFLTEAIIKSREMAHAHELKMLHV